MAANGIRYSLYLLIVIVGGTIAVMDQPFLIQVALGIFITAIAAIAWDILSRTGQVSLGTAAFFGIGAYGTALFEPVFGATGAWIASIFACGIIAMLLGLLTLRLRRMYFAITTLAFALSMQVMVLIFSDWTGGAGGISPPFLADGDPRYQLLAVTGFLLLAAVVSDIFLSLRFRPAFFMIRTNPKLAASSGVDVVRFKVMVFTVSGILSGISGACYAGLYGYVVPGDVFNLHWSIIPLAAAIMGGLDTTLGPVVGALLLRVIEEVARSTIGGVGYAVVYGIVIILFVMAAPDGVTGRIRAIWKFLGRKSIAKIGHRQNKVEDVDQAIRRGEVK
jgi:branched-chain amino acid transport system permease protein